MTVAHFDPTEVEGIFPATYEGIAIGDRITLTKSVADDLPAGSEGVVVALDNHKGYPVTANMSKPVRVASLPLALDEIAVVPA